MINILNVIGTRPEAIKMFPVVLEMKKHQDKINQIICCSGQHIEMVDQVLNLFKIEPDIKLNIMKKNQSLTSVTINLMEQLGNVITDLKPDWIVAQGDTTSVMVSSVLAFYNNIKFGHIESGLRTGNIHNPFPEEVNRRISDLLSELCFVPTAKSRTHLITENYPTEKIKLTGNTVVDAALYASKLPYVIDYEKIPKKIFKNRIILITTHRRESFGQTIKDICKAFKALANANENINFVFPTHLNPNVKLTVNSILSNIENVFLLQPLDYVSFINLLKKAFLILTDSGGIQEEAPTFNIPTLVLRNNTERPESVECGISKVKSLKKLKNLLIINTFIIKCPLM